MLVPLRSNVPLQALVQQVLEEVDPTTKKNSLEESKQVAATIMELNKGESWHHFS